MTEKQQQLQENKKRAWRTNYNYVGNATLLVGENSCENQDKANVSGERGAKLPKAKLPNVYRTGLIMIVGPCVFFG